MSVKLIFQFSTYIFSADIADEMLKLGRVTKVKEFFLVLVYVFNIDLFEFSVAILEKGLSRVDRGYRSRCSDQHLTTDTFCNMSIPDNYLLFGENTENVHLFSTHKYCH